jgi:hypothetical protein
MAHPVLDIIVMALDNPVGMTRDSLAGEFQACG